MDGDGEITAPGDGAPGVQAYDQEPNSLSPASSPINSPRTNAALSQRKALAAAQERACQDLVGHLNRSLENDQSEVKEYTETKTREIDIFQLVFDDKKQYGQCRIINPARVNNLLRRLREEPPRVPVAILVYDMQGMWVGGWD
jgi:hypothetical protein